MITFFAVGGIQSGFTIEKQQTYALIPSPTSSRAPCATRREQWFHALPINIPRRIIYMIDKHVFP